MQVRLDGLAAAIDKELKDYRNEIKEIIDVEVRETAKETAEELRQTAPKRTGDYANSWTYKTDKTGSATVYARAPYYRLTHLLEHGHLNRDGTRTPGKEHIGPARDRAEESLYEKVVRQL